MFDVTFSYLCVGPEGTSAMACFRKHVIALVASGLSHTVKHVIGPEAPLGSLGCLSLLTTARLTAPSHRVCHICALDTFLPGKRSVFMGKYLHYGLLRDLRIFETPNSRNSRFLSILLFTKAFTRTFSTPYQIGVCTQTDITHVSKDTSSTPRIFDITTHSGFLPSLPTSGGPYARQKTLFPSASHGLISVSITLLSPPKTRTRYMYTCTRYSHFPIPLLLSSICSSDLSGPGTSSRRRMPFLRSQEPCPYKKIVPKTSAVTAASPSCRYSVLNQS